MGYALTERTLPKLFAAGFVTAIAASVSNTLATFTLPRLIAARLIAALAASVGVTFAPWSLYAELFAADDAAAPTAAVRFALAAWTLANFVTT